MSYQACCAVHLTLIWRPTADSRIDVSRVAAAACRIPDGGDAAGAGVPSTSALDGAEIGRSGLPQPVGAKVFPAMRRPPSEPEPTALKSPPTKLRLRPFNFFPRLTMVQMLWTKRAHTSLMGFCYTFQKPLFEGSDGNPTDGT